MITRFNFTALLNTLRGWRTSRTDADALGGVTRSGWYTPTTQALEEKPAPVGQTRRGSLLESLVNILVGYSINFTANLLIFPLFGWNISTRENLTLGVIYTGISLVRSYGLRRFFNHKDLKKKMKIALSLFDGMSCGQLALQRAGISVDYYLASEVDQYAMTVTKKNFPETEHIGDVREVDGTSMVSPFILMGGSPCQSFSFAGKRNGMSTEQGEEVTTLERYLELKSEGFAFSGQSYLFWEFVRVLRETKPKYFLLENVRMVQKWARVISDTLGVEPIMINSALVSGQNRQRLYWTNIPAISQPEDRGITLQSVLSSGAVDRKKAHCLDANYWKGASWETYLKKSRRQQVMDPTPERSRKLTPLECERLQTVPDGYTEGVSNTQRYKMLGNGWTVDVIAHILSHIPEEER